MKRDSRTEQLDFFAASPVVRGVFTVTDVADHSEEKRLPSRAEPIAGALVVAIGVLSPQLPAMPEKISTVKACRDEIDRAMEELPPERVWLTYRDIERAFGVSRATVARRMKGGLVPGVVMENGRVVQEGAVRRFSRHQVRAILLSVRLNSSAQVAAVG